jgi:hypothetical protein
VFPFLLETCNKVIILAQQQLPPINKKQDTERKYPLKERRGRVIKIGFLL